MGVTYQEPFKAFRFLVEVDPEVMGCYMPNFILQPLV